MTLNQKTYELIQQNRAFKTLFWHNFLRFRKLTAPLRMAPDFMIVGAPRCGTSSLFCNLLKHPNILSPLHQEIHFFDKNFDAGYLSYQSNFPLRTTQVLNSLISRQIITGEGTSSYLSNPDIPRRIFQFKPDMKIIMMLRDPVERAYLQHHRCFSQGKEHLPFEVAIAQEQAKIQAEFTQTPSHSPDSAQLDHHQAYLYRGLYAHHLKPWLNMFPRHQIHIIKSEDFFNDPSLHYRAVLKFLELPDWEPKHYRFFGPFTPISMSATTRDQLTDYFQPHNQALSRLLNQDFGWTKASSFAQVY